MPKLTFDLSKHDVLLLRIAEASLSHDYRTERLAGRLSGSDLRDLVDAQELVGRMAQLARTQMADANGGHDPLHGGQIAFPLRE